MRNEKDIRLAVVIGIITGAITSVLLYSFGPYFSSSFAQLVNRHYLMAWSLPAIVPVIFVIGIHLGRFLGQRWPIFHNFARFVAIGFNNFAIDFAVLNLLVLTTHITQGVYFSAFKTAAFLVALINSYIWNKYWTFDAGQSGGGGGEVFKFVIVVGVSLLINVGISSLIVNYIPPAFGMTAVLWLNVASVIAVAIGLFWNFIGMRLIVFNK